MSATNTTSSADGAFGDPQLILGGISFGEGPRWHAGRLWFSDMHGQAVYSIDRAHSVTTLHLAGRSPSGLGFRPDGSLLIASVTDRTLLRSTGGTVEVVADLSGLAPADLGDMVVDDLGRAYVGSQAPTGGVIIRIDPDSTARIVADGLAFPNGMVISADRKSLILAESLGRQLTSFELTSDGGLRSQRTWADLDGFAPDGIALDRDGGIWVALPLAGEFRRILRGGEVTHRVRPGLDVAIACALGGPDRRTLFMLSSTSAYPSELIGTNDSRLEQITVDIEGAGLP